MILAGSYDTPRSLSGEGTTLLKPVITSTPVDEAEEDNQGSIAQNVSICSILYKYEKLVPHDFACMGLQ